MQAPERIRYLDGLRGLAIVGVYLFHVFARWPGVYPYGDRYAEFPFFEHGWLGVQLFFMISGFVILMSLERCRTLSEFLVKRWIRLFPAMFFCSLIVFLSAPLFPERPLGQPSLYHLLPGLTFIEPYFWSLLTGHDFGLGLEGVFWSLYVEVKLYLVAGIVFFLIGWRAMIMALTGFFLVSVGTSLADLYASGDGWAQSRHLLWLISGRSCGFFASGALYYRFVRSGERKYLAGAMALALASAVAESIWPWEVFDFAWGRLFAALIMTSLFFAAVVSQRARAIFESRVLLFLGLVSYPLYLMHENMTVALIVQGSAYLGWLPEVLAPLLPMGAVVFLAWLVTIALEAPARRRLRHFLE